MVANRNSFAGSSKNLNKQDAECSGQLTKPANQTGSSWPQQNEGGNESWQKYCGKSSATEISLAEAVSRSSDLIGSRPADPRTVVGKADDCASTSYSKAKDAVTNPNVAKDALTNCSRDKETSALVSPKVAKPVSRYVLRFSLSFILVILSSLSFLCGNNSNFVYFLN